MSAHYLKTFQLALENPELTVEKLKNMLENTDFFLKILQLKIESNDSEMQNDAAQELKALKLLLETHIQKR